LFLSACLVQAATKAQAADMSVLPVGDLDARATLFIGIFTGIICFSLVSAVLFLRAARKARRAEARARSNAGQYDRKLDFLAAVVGSDPQLLVHWNESGDPAIVANSLGSDLAVPDDVARLVRFGGWLKPETAAELESSLEQLHSEGHGFEIELETKSGATVIADGLVAGSGSVLKLRSAAADQSGFSQIVNRDSPQADDAPAARAVLDALPMPVWFFDSKGRIEWVNEAYANAVEAETAQEARDQQYQILGAAQRKAALSALEHSDSYDCQLDGAGRGKKDRLEAVLMKSGEARIGIAMDPVDQSSRTNELSRHFSQQSGILDQISTAIAVFSAERQLTYFNNAFVDHWGLDADWLKGRPRDSELLDKLRDMRRLPEQADYRDWKRKQLAIDDSGKIREDWWHLPDGRTTHVVANRAPDGSVTYLYEDETETLALKSRFNALMRVQKETLDHLGEGVAVFGSDGRLKLFNPSFATIWNLDPESLNAEPHIDDVIKACREQLNDATAWSELKAAVTSIDDQREPIEGQLERPDGVYLAYAGLPLPDGATLLTYVDISDTKRMENALIERNEALVAADRLKSAFISHVSYELRTPLTNIIGFSEFLQNSSVGPLNDKQQEYLGDIRSSSDTLLAIIDDILDLATIDAGGLDLKITPVTAKEIIDGAVLGVRDRLSRSNIKLYVKIGKNVGKFNADAKRMTQALYNLLSNAIGFSEPGSAITVTCNAKDGMVTFRVDDEGCGIPADYQQSVFDRFESRPQGSRHRGAGLGLAIVKSIVELHSGSVELHSTLHEGTSVTIRMPSQGPQVREQQPSAAA
jgi:signal transduction histidine kinase